MVYSQIGVLKFCAFLTVLMVARRFFTDSKSGYGAGWVTYSIVDSSLVAIYLGGVAIVICIERAEF